MAHVILSSAAFRGFRFTVGPKRGDGAPIVIAEFTAPWTEANRKAGGWLEIPETVSGNVSLLPPGIAATNIEFTPGKGMQQHAFSMEVSAITGCHCFVPTKEGKPRELRFSVETANIKAGRQLDTYGRTAGGATGKLKISVDASAEKEEALISPEQAADTASEE